jgi:hypothetical protein
MKPSVPRRATPVSFMTPPIFRQPSIVRNLIRSLARLGH